jgi:hypothetical protein
MGLRPVLGRLLDAHDDGPKATGAVVLTYRFWSTALKSDPAVLGKNRPSRFIPRFAQRHGGGRSGAVRSLPRLHRNHRQCGHQLTSSFRDYADQRMHIPKRIRPKLIIRSAP